MSVARFAISFDPELTRAVRRARGSVPMSTWLADAARRKLRAEGLLQAVREWEDEHGELLEAELRAEARRQRGLRPRR
jgi:histidinol-phosphate/aromatic aminotransferase/cobyric acid decarboxylase-like protein